MDLAVEDWYWHALEDASMLSSGLLTLDDLTLPEYTLAQEVSTARANVRAWRASVEARRAEKRR